MNAAVTAVGGIVGQSIIKALQNTEYAVIGINSEVLGVGLYAANRSYIGPYANDPKFIDRLLEICKKEDCKVIFSGLDAELMPLSKNIEKFKINGVFPAVSGSEVVETCTDKWKTFKFLKNNNLPTPQTYKLENYSFEMDFPVILKPRKGGQASKGVFLVSNRREFDKYNAQLDVNNYLVQEFIEGDEYTCGTVSLEDNCVGTIVMKRELREGNTYRAFVVKDEKLMSFVKRAINFLKPFGPCNVQLRLRDEIPYIIEFNARCSGTTASRALAGFNEPEMVCDYICRGVRNPHFEIKEIVILRYWQELVVDSGKIRQMELEGFVQNEGVRL